MSYCVNDTAVVGLEVAAEQHQTVAQPAVVVVGAAAVGHTVPWLVGADQGHRRSYPQTNLECQIQMTPEPGRHSVGRYRTRPRDRCSEMGPTLELVGRDLVNRHFVVFVAVLQVEQLGAALGPVVTPQKLVWHCR